MSITYIILVVLIGVATLLALILRFKLSAFLSLLITSILMGILAGMSLPDLIQTIQKGMGNTLGFVATVVGLGAIFGQLLESSGGAKALANQMLKWFGKEKASWAMVITGFIISIPVFFDVGLVILAPILYALTRDSGKSLLHYGIPLIAGMAVTHAFIPPTPGPIAVAEILQADLGWVIFFGVLIGIPTAIVAGPIFGKYIAKKIEIHPPSEFDNPVDDSDEGMPSFWLIIAIIATPLFLILFSTLTALLVKNGTIPSSTIADIIVFIGHPFTALIIATLLAIVFICVRQGMSNQQIMDLSTKALGPAGIIILITGAGGVLKQVLIDSGMGKLIAESMAEVALPVILLAWILAVIVRVIQGSATVAMITAAGIIAPILEVFELNTPHTALVVIAIAAGSTFLSHVNDSGFWLVSRYFGMDEKQTLQTWSVMESIIGVSGLILALIASLFI